MMTVVVVVVVVMMVMMMMMIMMTMPAYEKEWELCRLACAIYLLALLTFGLTRPGYARTPTGLGGSGGGIDKILLVATDEPKILPT